jgi:hypothetical protein
MEDISNLNVKITCKCDTTGFDVAISKVNEFKRALKLSIFQIIKIKLIHILFPYTKPKITIQEIIDNERNK